MDAFRRAPERKNSEMYFVISSLTLPPPSEDSVPDITDFAPDMLAAHRTDIVHVTAALAAEPLSLMPPQRKLRLRTSEALAAVTGFKLPTERILMLSASGMTVDPHVYRRARDGTFTPEARRLFATLVKTRLASSLADTLVSRLDARIMDKLGPKAYAELGRLVSAGLKGLRVRADLAHVSALGDTLLRPFRECLRLQFGCVAAGMDDLTKLVVPFTDLFCAGNYPLGTMDDGTFLILVA